MEVNVNEENVKKLKEKVKNQKRINKLKIIIAIALVVIIIVGIIFIKKIIKKNTGASESKTIKAVESTLVGKWTTDGNTFYEFEKEGKGAIIVPSITLPFSYTVEEDVINVDFENEDSEDTAFSYELNEDKLTLRSVNGTFEFSRVQD